MGSVGPMSAAALLLAATLAHAGQPVQKALPRVLVLATGGTIAHLPNTPGRPDTYISGENLVGDVADVAKYARLRVEEVSRIGSSEITPDLWLDLAARINKAFQDDRELAGVVVTHGSNTVEETAYFLSLTVN